MGHKYFLGECIKVKGNYIVMGECTTLNSLDSSKQLLISSKERGQLFGGSGRVEWAIWIYQQSTAYGKRETISLNIRVCGTIDWV